MFDPAFVSVPWVRANLEAPGITLVDGSWHMPASGRDARAEFSAKALPGAVFFDIEQVADINSDLPHTCPTSSQFSQAMSGMGIKNTDFIVIYDAQGLFAAARVWWLFRLFGHKRVAIMTGGLPAWEAAGLPTGPGQPTKSRSEPYVVKRNDELFASSKTFIVPLKKTTSLFLTHGLRGVFPEPNLSQGPVSPVVICLVP